MGVLSLLNGRCTWEVLGWNRKVSEWRLSIIEIASVSSMDIDRFNSKDSGDWVELFRAKNPRKAQY